jgi:hypothetical protein
MERPTCGTCPFWDWESLPAPEDPGHNRVGGVPQDGMCRRFPGTPIMEEPADVNHEPLIIAHSPTTGCDEWCGEHPSFPAYLEARRLDRRGEGA